MKDTMTEFSFCDWFRKSENRKNQFSYEGLKALYEHLIQFEKDHFYLDEKLIKKATLINQTCKIELVQ